MLSLFLQDAAVSSAPYFFGYMGAAFALVFASASLCPRSHPPPPTSRRAPQCVPSGVLRERGSVVWARAGAAPARGVPTDRAHRPDTAARCVLADLGAAYGTAKSGVGVASMGVLKPELVMRSIIPVIMAGVIGIYGLIVAVIVMGAIPAGQTGYCAKVGFAHFGSGMSVGLSGLAAGTAIGIVGDAGVRATAQQPKLFVGMILILIFAEAL